MIVLDVLLFAARNDAIFQFVLVAVALSAALVAMAWLDKRSES